MKGELKLAQWIRGSTLQWTTGYNKAASSYGSSMGHSELWWRRFLRQSAASGALERELKSLIKKNSHYCIQGLYRVLPRGREIVLNSEGFSVPKLEDCKTIDEQSHSMRKRSISDDSVIPPKKKICTKTGKGTHGLRVVKTLLEDEENWKHISSKDDYQYLGVFPNEQMQVIYYSEDCTKLDQSCSTDPHFLWHDIQMSKGKVNKDYPISVEFGSSTEELIYQCAPCNGVKVCSRSECNFVAPISRLRSCPDHPEATLKRSNDISLTNCPVEFAYIFPKDFNHDNRRWIMGYIRQQKAPTDIYTTMPFHVEQRCVHL